MKISRQALEAITKHAWQSRPYECCGILLYNDDNRSIVGCVIPAENVEKENPKTKYILGHKAHLKAVNIEASGDACIAGYYHSHPDGEPRPSRHDVEQAVSDVTYLITGLGNGETKHAAWRFEEGDLVPEPLEVSE